MNPLSLLFRQGNQVLFLPQILLKLGNVEFIVPVNVSISMRKKLIITEIYGADWNVKDDFGCGDFSISVDGQIGNTDSSVGAKICGIAKNVSALDFLARLVKLTRGKGPYEISDVNQEFTANIIGRTVRKIDQAFDMPFGNPLEPEGILNRLGITKVVIQGIDIAPLPGGHYSFHLDLLSEPGGQDVLETDKINIFLTEK